MLKCVSVENASWCFEIIGEGFLNMSKYLLYVLILYVVT